jgi:hypothetical protein
MNVSKKHPLRLWAFANDWTITDVAAHLGVTQGLVSLWMAGRRRIPGSTAYQIKELTQGSVSLEDWPWMLLEGDGCEIRWPGAGRERPRAEAHAP